MQTVRLAMTTELVRFEAARRALADARTIDEVKDVRDKAEALRLYMKQAGHGLEMQNDVAEIKLRAERRAGELLEESLQHGGDPTLRDVRLRDIGISEVQSHRWQAEASVPEEDFERHVTEVKSSGGELTSVGLLRLAKSHRRDGERSADVERISGVSPLEDIQPHSTIVLDPPWDWGDEGDVSQFGRARPRYATMPLTDIAALPIERLSEPNAHIYLWITNRSLPKGFNLLDRWGFRYITMLTWCKPSIGMGNYFRGSTEQVLFGVRGSLALQRHDVGTWFQAPRGNEHSAKPDSLYELVERCSPGPWLELFARHERQGWTVWGPTL